MKASLLFNGTRQQANSLGANLPFYCQELVGSKGGKRYPVPINATRRNELNQMGYDVVLA